MMFDNHLTITQAAKRFPRRNGKRPSVKTVRRWITRGVGGVFLQADKIGRDWYTTPEWIEQFVAKATAKATPTGATRAIADNARDKEILRRRYGINVG